MTPERVIMSGNSIIAQFSRSLIVAPFNTRLPLRFLEQSLPFENNRQINCKFGNIREGLFSRNFVYAKFCEN